MTDSTRLYPASLRYHPAGGLTPASTPAPHGLSPQQVRRAYGVDAIKFGTVAGDGRGQTIAIIDAYHAPTISRDLAAFDAAFGLAAPPSFRQVAQDGTTNYPRTDPTPAGGNTWESETALDVEWAHAIAPGANILLVEAKSDNDTDLWAAVDYARRQPGVSVVSMSFGGSETSTQTSADYHFTTPSGHAGVSFFAAAGDSGAYDPAGNRAPEYPASSPNVVAVGGTTLTVGTGGTYTSERGWSGSGGGISTVESQPAYQRGAVTQSTTRRAIPDVSLVADPGSGVVVYDSYDNGTSAPWATIGGTSLSAPAWAAITAIANQGRATKGLAALDGKADLLPKLYSLRGTNAFHDITTGNNGYAAGTGFDLVTGLGTPRADVLMAALAGTGTATPTPTPTPTVIRPTNDQFAAARVITGASLTVTGNNFNATKESGEPKHAGNAGGASVWFKWTAPASASTTISTAGSTFDTTLAVYKGTAVGTLTQVAANDDASSTLSTSKATFTAAAGTTYYIAVDGYADAGGAPDQGNVTLALTQAAATARPANDNFAAAKVLTGSAVSVTASSVNATRETNEPKITGNAGGKSVWFTWTAAGTGTTTVNLSGSTFDTLLGVYKGTAVGALTLVASNDDASSTLTTSKVTFTATKGLTYRIAVDGYNGGAGAASGTIKLALSGVVTAAARVTSAARPAVATPAADETARRRRERTAATHIVGLVLGQA